MACHYAWFIYPPPIPHLQKWLFFVAPPILLLTYFLVASISVYSGSVLNITRGQMAENGMIGLALVTAVFVLVHCLSDWRGCRRQ